MDEELGVLLCAHKLSHGSYIREPEFCDQQAVEGSRFCPEHDEDRDVWGDITDDIRDLNQDMDYELGVA